MFDFLRLKFSPRIASMELFKGSSGGIVEVGWMTYPVYKQDQWVFLPGVFKFEFLEFSNFRYVFQYLKNWKI